jgi:hypothetical protein
MDGNGNAVAIWLQTTSSTSGIDAAYLAAGGTWTAPMSISAAGATATNPTLAVNSLGDAVAGWQSTSGEILVAERRSGVWTAPISIAPPSFRQGSPHLALNDHGDAAIAWTGRGTALVATRAAGASWTAPTTISTKSSGATARVALDNSGNAVMIFELVQYSGSSYTYPVQAVARPAGGSWGTPKTISGANDYGSTPNVVATPAGTFVAAWVDDTSRTARAAVRSIGQANFAAYAVLSSGSDAFLAAAAGHTAATWIGGGPAVQVSDNNTP